MSGGVLQGGGGRQWPKKINCPIGKTSHVLATRLEGAQDGPNRECVIIAFSRQPPPTTSGVRPHIHPHVRTYIQKMRMVLYDFRGISAHILKYSRGF